MHIVIIEDEPPIAEEIEAYCHAILGERIRNIKMFHTLEDASAYLDTHPIDLCLLDLNLHGENGYDILKRAVSGDFQTIVISAYTDQALEAFEYGVTDFVPKPFNKERLEKAFDRILDASHEHPHQVKYVVARRQGKYQMIPLPEIVYFKADRSVIEVHQKSGNVELIDKSLNQLEQVLPEFFVRIHRSHIVNIREAVSYQHKHSGVYQITLKDHTVLPLGRKYNSSFREQFIE